MQIEAHIGDAAGVERGETAGVDGCRVGGVKRSCARRLPVLPPDGFLPALAGIAIEMRDRVWSLGTGSSMSPRVRRLRVPAAVC